MDKTQTDLLTILATALFGAELPLPEITPELKKEARIQSVDSFLWGRMLFTAIFLRLISCNGMPLIGDKENDTTDTLSVTAKHRVNSGSFDPMKCVHLPLQNLPRRANAYPVGTVPCYCSCERHGKNERRCKNND